MVIFMDEAEVVFHAGRISDVAEADQNTARRGKDSVSAMEMDPIAGFQ
jgi:hypothetical protein